MDNCRLFTSFSEPGVQLILFGQVQLRWKRGPESLPTGGRDAMAIDINRTVPFFSLFFPVSHYIIAYIRSADIPIF
jgi:hypothetical protein